MQYVRVQKTYLVEQAAIHSKPHPDSMYFAGDVQVTIERWKNNKPVETVFFEPFDELVKDTGFFPTENHLVYRGKLNIQPLEKYFLYVYIGDKEHVLFAETSAVGPLSVTDPMQLLQRKVSLNTGQNYICRWTPVTNAGIYQVILRFKYDENLNGVSTRHYLDLPQSFTNPITNVDYLTKEISGSRFMKVISEEILPVEGMERMSTGLDFIIISGGIEMKYYIESTQPSDGALMEKPVYSNLSNGIGLFSSMARIHVEDLVLASTTIDSLAYGALTFQLGFLDHNGDRDSTQIKRVKQ